MEVAVHERRRDEPAARLDRTRGLRCDVRFDGDDTALAAGDIEVGAAVGEGGVLDEEVEGHEPRSILRRNGRTGRVPHLPFLYSRQLRPTYDTSIWSSKAGCPFR